MFTAFADEIGAAEGCEHCYACSDRTLIAVLVVRHSVVGQQRSIAITVHAHIVVFLIGHDTAFEQSAFIGLSEGSETQSEDDCDC